MGRGGARTLRSAPRAATVQFTTPVLGFLGSAAEVDYKTTTAAQHRLADSN